MYARLYRVHGSAGVRVHQVHGVCGCIGPRVRGCACFGAAGWIEYGVAPTDPGIGHDAEGGVLASPLCIGPAGGREVAKQDALGVGLWGSQQKGSLAAEDLVPGGACVRALIQAVVVVPVVVVIGVALGQ